LRAALLGLSLLAATAAAEPAAWRVETAEGTELWLLGSVHYLRDEDLPLPDSVENLYRRADTLVMELDLDDLDPFEVQLQFMQAAMLPPAESLRGVLSEDVYATVASSASDLELDLEAFERFEPWLVALMLLDLRMASLGFSAAQGLEQQLLRRSGEDGKPILGLEPIAAQIGVFDDLPMTEQEALLRQTLEELESPASEMDELLNAWHAGSLDELTDELLASFADFPTLYQALVVARNRRWLTELERLAREPGRFLVVVGALHLVGQDSVVELLRDRGFDVVRFQLR
jgi:hypothetical protein